MLPSILEGTTRFLLHVDYNKRNAATRPGAIRVPPRAILDGSSLSYPRESWCRQQIVIDLNFISGF
jgi:hypothetical protein